MSVRLSLLGTGDAFSHGGRFHTCFLVEYDEHRLLMDCGGTAPAALKRAGLGVHDVDAILLSHFHGDHFGGVPYLLVDMRIHGRTRPLTLAGPPGVRERVFAAMEALYAGTGGKELPFPLEIAEYGPGAMALPGGATLHAYPVIHSPPALPHALRLEVGGRVLAYSGDTEWTDTLLEVAADADVFLCECSSMAPLASHMDYPTLLARSADLTCSRLLLTHLGPDVLAQGHALALACAHDGMVVEI